MNKNQYLYTEQLFQKKKINMKQIDTYFEKITIQLMFLPCLKFL